MKESWDNKDKVEAFNMGHSKPFDYNAHDLFASKLHSYCT